MEHEIVVKGDFESNILIKNKKNDWISINRGPVFYTVNSNILVDEFYVNERELSINPTLREFFRGTQEFSAEKTKKKLTDYAIASNKGKGLIKLDKDDLNLSFRVIKKMFLNPNTTKENYQNKITPFIYDIADEISKTLKVRFTKHDLTKVVSVIEMPTMAYQYPEKVIELQKVFSRILEKLIQQKYSKE